MGVTYNLYYVNNSAVLPGEIVPVFVKYIDPLNLEEDEETFSVNTKDVM